jgi:hypothetical protein
VANAIDPAFALPDENLGALEARLDIPLLLQLPWFDQTPDPADLASRVVR